MRLSLLDRLVTTEVGTSLAFGVGFFSTLLTMNHAFYLARLAITQGMPYGMALQLFVYKVPPLVAFTAPMGVLLATVLGISRLTDHNEIAALRVCGMSLYRIAAPAVLLGCVAAVGILVFTEGVVSIANDRYRTVFNNFITKSSELQPVQNVFFQGPSPEGNAMYYAQRYTPKTQTLWGVTVVYIGGGKGLRIIQAKRATYRQEGAWTFHDGEVYLTEAGRVVTTQFGTMDLNVPATPQALMLPAKGLLDMNMRELLAMMRKGGDTRAIVLEFQNRLAAPASSIAFAIVGIPLSLRPHRSGPSIGMGLSIVVLLGYYTIYIPSQLASEGHALPPALAAWLPNLIVGAIGGVLLARAAR